MNLYLVSQSQHNDYDTYDAIVVVAKSAKAAVRIHPYGAAGWKEGVRFKAWCSSPRHAEAKLLGIASPDLKEGEVVLASFNAG
jgi:hypothetical protein